MIQASQRSFKAARIVASLYRFNTLRIANRVFSSVSDEVVSRHFYGKTLYLNVSRGNPQRLLYLEGERFVEERDIIRQLMRPGVASIDVGANIGYYALMLAHYAGDSAELICIEPDPANLVELRQNIEANHLTNVTILAAGAAAEDGSAELLGGVNGRIVSAGGEIKVRTLALDTLADRSIGFIKIDVEGYELEVLRGARKLLQEQPRYRAAQYSESVLRPHTLRLLSSGCKSDWLSRDLLGCLQSEQNAL
jgi:FkbM family methyltransferase